METLRKPLSHIARHTKFDVNSITMNGDAFLLHFKAALLEAKTEDAFKDTAWQYLEWMPINSFIIIADLFTDQQPRYKEALIASIKKFIDQHDCKAWFVEFNQDYTKFRKL